MDENWKIKTAIPLSMFKDEYQKSETEDALHYV